MPLFQSNTAGSNSFSQAGHFVQTTVVRLIHQPIKFYINITFHLLLVAFHGVLLTYEVDHKSGKQHQTDLANGLYRVVTTVIQWVSKAYQPILAWLTQGLALQHILKTAPSLSSLHDQSGAWLGLIPALLSLFRQIRKKTAVLGITLIALYYCLIFLFGHTTTRYFDLGTRYNNTLLGQTTHILTQLDADDIMDAFPVVDILPQIGAVIETYGLRGNYVFDLGSQGGPSDVLTSTSATQFNVSCFNIPELLQSITPADINIPNPVYSFHVDDAMEDIQILPTPGAVNLANSRRRSDNQTISTLFITFVGAPVTDQLGNISSTTRIDPPIVEDCPRGYICNNATNLDYIQSVQMLACDVRANNSTIQIDTSLRPVRVPYYDGIKVWSNWTSSQSPVPSYLAPIGSFSSLSPPSENLDVRTVSFPGANSTATRRLSLLEDAVWKSLTSSDGGIVFDPNYRWDLAEVEFALGRVIAIVYWRASIRALTKQLTFSYNDTDGEDVLILDIQFRRGWAWAGLGISTAAFLVAFALTLQPYTPSRVAGQGEDDGGIEFIESPGILQIVWLIGNKRTPEWADLPGQLHEKLSGKPPKGSALKNAGMKISLNSASGPAAETASLVEKGGYDAIDDELRPQLSSARYDTNATL